MASLDEFIALQQRLIAQGLPPAGFRGGPSIPNCRENPNQPTQPDSSIEGLVHEPESIDFIRESSWHPYHSTKQEHLLSPFESACVHGPLSRVQSAISSEDLAPIALHHGLNFAIDAGNLEIVNCLLASGTRLSHQTSERILTKAPADKHIALFELLMAHTRWDPNTRLWEGDVLLPKVVTNLPLLRWFLTHGANPNFGNRPGCPKLLYGPTIDSAQALEAAAGRAPLEAVQMLLDAGAQVKNGTPLHSAAAAAYTPGTDDDRIPIIDLLVSHGADVNQKRYTPYVTPNYPLTCAVEAKAPERVKRLLDHGANPHLKGKTGSAVKLASYMGEEIKRIVEEGVEAQKWMQNASPKVHQA